MIHESPHMTHMSHLDNYVDFGDFYLKKVEWKEIGKKRYRILFCKLFLSNIVKYSLGQKRNKRKNEMKMEEFYDRMEKAKKFGNGIFELGGTIICGHMKVYFTRFIHCDSVEHHLKMTGQKNHAF